jgi:hypothetical protein
MLHQLLAFVVVDQAISLTQIKRELIPVVLQIPNRLAKLTLREHVSALPLAGKQLLEMLWQSFGCDTSLEASLFR